MKSNTMKTNKLDKKLPLTKEEKEKRIIIAKIENIYGYFNKDEPTYYIFVRYLTLVICTFCFSIVWSFSFFTSRKINNSYCLDNYSNTFIICDFGVYCWETDFTHNIYIYTDDSTLANPDVIKETYNVNKKYTHFFTKGRPNFQRANYDIIN